MAQCYGTKGERGVLFLVNGDIPPPALDGAQDIDVFQVSAAKNYRLMITVDGTKGDLDPNLRVYDNEG